MLVTNRAKFDEMLEAIRTSDILTCDTEGTGLRLYHGDRAIGIALHTSSNDQTYYMAFDHGTKADASDDWRSMGKWSAARKVAFAQAVYAHRERQQVFAENLPMAWLDDLKAVWLTPRLHLAHNWPYDLTAFAHLGFPTPRRIADTMSMLAVVNSDWYGEDYTPLYRMPDTGEYERGGRGLKWQARLWQLPDATDGMDSLEDAVLALKQRLQEDVAAYIFETETAHDGNDNYALVSKRIEALRQHVDLPMTGKTTTAQSYLWMLRPSAVAAYAESDVRLTKALYDKLLKWGNRWNELHVMDLYNDVTLATWEMGFSGLRIDLPAAAKMIAEGERHLEELRQQMQRMSRNNARVVKLCAALRDAAADGDRLDIITTVTQVIEEPSTPDELLTDVLRTLDALTSGDLKLHRIYEELSAAAQGMIRNPSSNPQVLAYLRSLGLKIDSTNKYALRGIRDVPLVGLLSEYRTLGINLKTFVKKWHEYAVDSKIRFSYNVGGTASGRLSSSDKVYGNAQNISKTSAKNTVNPKLVLYPPKGTIWVEIDYKALEVHYGAFVSETVVGGGRDLTLTRILEADADMHLAAMERSGIYDILLRGRTPTEWLTDNGYRLDADSLEEMTPDKYFLKKIARQTQKTANFASQYGAGVRGIIKAVGCSEAEARAMLAGFHEAFPAMSKAMDFFQELALKPRPISPDTELMANFVRYPIPELSLARKFGYYPAQMPTKNGGTWSPRKSAARTAFNSVVQGLGGLTMLASILRVKNKYGFARPLAHGEYDFSQGIVVPLATVHDSFDFALRPQDLGIVPDILDLLTDWDVRPRLQASVEATLLDGAWGTVRGVHDLSAWIESHGTEGFKNE